MFKRKKKNSEIDGNYIESEYSIYTESPQNHEDNSINSVDEKKARNKAKIEAEQELDLSTKKKKDSIFSVSAMFRNIEHYGYKYSMKKFLLQVLLVWAVLGIAGYFYKLKIICLIILAIIGLILTPAMVVSQFKFLYEQQRFADVGDYLEQLIYAFIKRPKILSSLEDTASLLEGRRIKDSIDEAIACIDSNDSTTPYRDGFKIIEDQYGCEKMSAVHEFMEKVEAEGGEYHTSILVLKDDLLAWVERTYVYQEKRRSIKMSIIAAIIMSAIMCGILTLYIPEDFTIVHGLPYQISSTIFLAAMAGIYTLSQTFLTGSWIDNKGERKTKEIVRDYRYYHYFDYKREVKSNLVWVISFSIVALISKFALQQNVFAIIFAFCAWWYLTLPKRKLKSSKKRLEADLQKAFPGWLRDVAISLQTETVQNAIIMSMDTIPTVLKPSVAKLIEDFSEDPTSFEPWNRFLAEYDVPQLKSAAKMFYSINQLGDEEATSQINTLIERNNKLAQQAEIMKAESAVSAFGYMVALPMGVSIFKLLFDLVLLLIAFMGLTSRIQIGI